MSMSDKFGLMTYPAVPKYNIGDYIQSLAAKQFLPVVNAYINRENLKDYSGDQVKMIMNGWYMHNPLQWPPSDKITPLFISFHINSHVQDALLDKEGVSYLRRHEPIGCRDLHTLNLLKSKGIQAYQSGCLTTTLDLRYKSSENTDNIYLADPLFQVPHLNKLMHSGRRFVKGIFKGEIFKINQRKQALSAILSKDLLEHGIPIRHEYSQSHSEQQRFKLAEEILHKYATARLVITSRIHCALPCLALGTPVVFLNYGFNSIGDLCRFEGITNLFNTINLSSSGEVSANFEFSGKLASDFSLPNPQRHIKSAEKLKEMCNFFVKGE